MKKFVSLFAVLVLCASLVCPVYAAEFVPSISDKSAPELVEGNIIKDGEELPGLEEDCLLITPVSEAKESDEIPDAAEQMLLFVYNGLKDGSMSLPYDKVGVDGKNMVIKDLFDVTWLCSDHPDIVAPAGVHVELTFDLGVAKDAKVVAMTYKHDQWNPVVEVTNNGDGTVTAVFEDFCPVVFAVSTGADQTPSDTGDNADLTLWIVLMVVAGAALVTLAVFGRKFIGKAK